MGAEVVASVAGLCVAALGGAAIGLERQWSGHATGPHARFGGIRTFTLLGVVAGLCGWMVSLGWAMLAVVLLASAAALVVIGYRVGSQVEIDATTEVAALVVLAAGVLAGAGHTTLGSAVTAVTVLLLLEKGRLHGLVARIDDEALLASARFAVMALVVLPLLPAAHYGPYGVIRPRELWALVLLFSGLGFCGWFARRAVGTERGIIISGLLGGLVSSTNVTIQMARDSRAAGAPRVPLAMGVVAACTVMLVRVGVIVTMLNPALALSLPRYLIPPVVGGAVVVLFAWRGALRAGGDPDIAEASPLELKPALQMAAIFQVVLLVIAVADARWGGRALAATSALVGLTDLDALTFSLARGTMGGASTTVALLAGIASNTLLKAVVAAVIGRGTFRVLTPLALVAIGVAGLVPLLIVWNDSP